MWEHGGLFYLNIEMGDIPLTLKKALAKGDDPEALEVTAGPKAMWYPVLCHVGF